MMGRSCCILVCNSTADEMASLRVEASITRLCRNNDLGIKEVISFYLLKSRLRIHEDFTFILSDCLRD